MTTALEIITRGFRESNLLPIGGTLTVPQQDEGLGLLNRVIASVYGNEVGDPLLDWPVGVVGLLQPGGWNETLWRAPRINSRILPHSNSAQTVYMPRDPNDGSRISLVDANNSLATYPYTLDGNGRNIEGAATLVLNTNGLRRTWMYRADLGEWVRLSELTAVTDVFPFPLEFEDFFSLRVAMRVNPRFGRAMADESNAELSRALRTLRARYRQKRIVPADIGVLALSDMVPRGPSSYALENVPPIVNGYIR